jgi:hypothetical protein
MPRSSNSLRTGRSRGRLRSSFRTGCSRFLCRPLLVKSKHNASPQTAALKEAMRLGCPLHWQLQWAGLHPVIHCGFRRGGRTAQSGTSTSTTGSSALR